MNPDETQSEAEILRQQVALRCSEIPEGRVESYGALGRNCDPPISGYVCGRVMAQVMDGAPWWRIVGKNGDLPINKRSPNHSKHQRELLEAEGVEFDDEGRVARRFFVGEEAEELSLF